jgi:phosphate transport system substrate-binding protein
MLLRFSIVFLLLACMLLVQGCAKQEPPPVVPPTLLLVSEPLERLMQEEAAQYVSIYPAQPMNVRAIDTREAIVHMLNDSVRNIAIDRPLNDEERSIAQQADLRIVENVFAKDALAIVVNVANPINEISVASARALVAGTPTWNTIPESKWDRPVDLVLTGRNSGAYELVQSTFFSLKNPVNVTTLAGSQKEALQRVADVPSAVTFVSSLLLKNLPSGTKALAVEAKEVQEGKRFVKPSQYDLYHTLYPFQYSLYLYTSESKTIIGSGFSTFVIVTIAGQKIVQNAGILPVNIPSRVIQLNSE